MGIQAKTFSVLLILYFAGCSSARPTDPVFKQTVREASLQCNKDYKSVPDILDCLERVTATNLALAKYPGDKASLIRDLAVTQMKNGRNQKAAANYKKLRNYGWAQQTIHGYLYENEFLNVGQTGPYFAGVNMQGNHVTLDDYKGRFLILFVWGPWCGPCKKDFKYINEIHKSFPERVSVLGVGVDTERDNVVAMLKQHSAEWTNIFEPYENPPPKSLSKLYNGNGYPAIFILDGTGKIIGKNIRHEELIAFVKKRTGRE